MGQLFEPGTGNANGSFVTEDEKAVLLVNKVVFPINNVVEAPDKFTPGGTQFQVETVLPGSDEARVLGFKAGSVPNRAAGLRNIMALIAAGTYTPINVRLVKDGRAILIEEA